MKEIKVTVDCRNNDKFLYEIDKINSKLSKYGYAHLEYEVDHYSRDPKTIRGYYDSYLIYYVVRTTFENTNLMNIDVNFEGTVELMKVGDDNTKLFNIPNEKISNIIFNDNHCVCDKCKKNIARGKYLVFSKSDREVKTRDDLIVLGTTCSKGYFPFNIESYLRDLDIFIEKLCQFDEDGGIYSISSKIVTLRNIARFTDVITNGLTAPYVKDTDGELGTLGKIQKLYSDFNSESEKDKEDAIKIMNQQTEKMDIEEMINTAREYWGKNWNKDSFSSTCNQVMQCDEVDKKYFRRVATALIFGNLNAKKEKEFIEKRSATSSYIMEEKEKFTNLELTFERILSFDTRYGMMGMMIFRDNEGHTLVWNTQKSTRDISTNGKPLVQGDKVYLNGTCKGHKDYRGEKQTVIKNCKRSFPVKVEEVVLDESCYKDEKAMQDFFKEMNGY